MNESNEPLARPLVTLFLVLTLVTGVAYPLLVTGVAQIGFARQAAGSLILKDGKPVGSELIGQSFSGPAFFWGRPSATSPMPYATVPSGASNQGPTNPALAEAVKSRVQALRAADPGNMAPVPVDLVTASGSGLDPHISVAAARYQLARVARARGLPAERVQAVLERHVEAPWLGFIGEPRVNVLRLNLEVATLH